MTRTDKIKHNTILNCIKSLDGRKDCQTARELLMVKLTKLELQKSFK
jgi:hypothetical protein